jgi:hypothetical protein
MARCAQAQPVWLWWPREGYSGVCQKPYQFSCWNKNDPNYAYLSGAKPIPFREFSQAQNRVI